MNRATRYSVQYKNKIQVLRQQGKSYRTIERETGVARSTLSYWLKDVCLTPTQKKTLYTKRVNALNQGPNSNRVRREKEIVKLKENAKKEIKRLPEIAYRIAGTMMYWAEGSKTNDTSVTNSDPRIVQFMVNWFNDVCGVPPKYLKAHLHIHYADNELDIKKYWAELTGIPLENFGKSYTKPQGTGHRKNILPNGIIRIRVKGLGSGDFRHRILAWADKVYELSKDRP